GKFFPVFNNSLLWIETMDSETKQDLTHFRKQIDALDDQIMNLIAERFAICAEVGHFKATHGIAVMQPERAAAVKERNVARGEAEGLRPVFTNALYELLINEACALENEIIDG
ncbi:MAG: chorismate mutase, partial [Pseudomonadota bacterium]